MNLFYLRISFLVLICCFFFTNIDAQNNQTTREDRLCERLMKAVKANSLSSVKAALKAGADINCMMPNDHSYYKLGALMPIIQDFIKEPVRQNDITETPLHAALRYHTDPIYLVKFLVSKGANLERLDSKGYAPIHIVANSGKRLCFRYLLEKQPDLNIQTLGGNSILNMLIFDNYLRGARLLLTKEGVWVSKKDGLKYPVIHQIFERESFFHHAPDVAFLKLLISKGADMNEVDSEGKNCLEIAMKYNHTPYVTFAVNHGAAIGSNHRIRGDSPVKMAEFFLKHGMKPTTKEFQRAIRLENIELVKVLLQNQVEVAHSYPFHIAALTNNKKMIDVLLDAGLDMNQLNQYGESVLLTAARRQFNQLDWVEEEEFFEITEERLKHYRMDTTFVKYLFKKGLKKHKLELNICLYQQKNELKKQAYYDFFIQLGGDPQSMNNKYVVDDKVLERYVYQNNYEALHLLLRHECIFNKGKLLGVAVNANQVRIIELLLEHHTSPDNPIEENGYSFTPLFRAIENGDLKLARILFQYNANPNLVKRYQNNTRGIAPLSEAIRMHREDLIKLLLRNGADPSNLSLTPLLLDQAYTEETLCLLIDNGIVFSKRASEKDKKYPSYLPIEIALVQRREKVVNCMFKNDVRIGGVNITKLYAESQINHQQILTLLEKGININKVYQEGLMIHIAILRKDESLIKHIVAHGADLNKRGSQQKKPYKLAKKQKLSREVLQLLKS